MTALTVFLSPGDPADGVLAGLTDLSAADLVDEFAWVRVSPGGHRVAELVLVAAGRSRSVSTDELAASRRTTRLRTCTLVPVCADAAPVDLSTEVAVTNALIAATGAQQVTRSRLLLAGPEGVHTALDGLVIEGWHNILISPEDSRGPQFGRIAVGYQPDAADFSRFAAPTVAALTGLWRDVAHSPLDDEILLPGRVLRLARSFYRRLRTDDVETRLRAEVLVQHGNLPMPSDQHAPITTVQDPGLAAATMSNALWDKHAAVLKGSRHAYENHEVRRLGGWQAIKMFFSFLWASLKNAPAAWYRSLVDGVSTRLAIGVQNVVFGDQSAAYEVVINGRRPNGQPANWSEIGEATSYLAGVAGVDPAQTAQADLSGVWQDYAAAAFTLGDAGTRGGSGRLQPVMVGAARGIVPDAGSIVPGPADRFSRVPGVLAAAIGTDGVDATDPLGITDLRRHLSELQADPNNGLLAGSTLKDLDGWDQANSQSFGSAVGRRLAGAWRDNFTELLHLLNKLRNAPEPPDPGAGGHPLSRWAQLFMFLWLVLTGVFIWLGVSERVQWWVSVVVVLGTLLLLLGSLCFAFLKSQRQLFTLLHQRKCVLSDRAVDEQNLLNVLADLRRLHQAYGQFVSWSRVLGSFLSAPLGPVPPPPPAPLLITRGMPMSTQVGLARPAEDQVSRAAVNLKRDLYQVGWLTSPWEELVTRVSPPISGRDTSSSASGLWQDRGAGSGSRLEQIAGEMFAGRLTSSGAELMWQNTVRLLSTTMSGLVPGLVGTVAVVGGPEVPLDEFLGGLDRPVPPQGSLATEVLTDAAVADSAAEIVTDYRRHARRDLGIVCAVTQLSDACTVDRLVRAGVSVTHDDGPIIVPAAPGGTPAPTQSPIPVVDDLQAPGPGHGFQF